MTLVRAKLLHKNCQHLQNAFRCTNGDFYVALGSSMDLALLVWVLYYCGNEPSLGQKSPILHKCKCKIADDKIQIQHMHSIQ